MNTTGIEWADASWNPIVGCDGPHAFYHLNSGNCEPGRCDYCYALECGKRLERTLGYTCCGTFEPHLHPERLVGDKAPAAVQTPKIVFCDSMGDWYGRRVDPDWRKAAFQAMREAYWHSYVVLTKRPDLICADELHDCAPESFWLGVSCSTRDDLHRVETLLDAVGPANADGHGGDIEGVHPMVSLEPWLDGLQGERGYSGLEWVIVGGRSAAHGVPAQTLTFDDREAARQWAIRSTAPIFEKPNIGGEPYQQRWPEAMREHLGG